MKTWDARVKDLEADGWTVGAIADAIGLSPQSVSDIKHRRTRAPVGYAAVRLHGLAGKLPPATSASHITGPAPVSKESEAKPRRQPKAA